MVKPALQDADFTLYNGDALEVLCELPAESVHMCVTSPPFFGLRDYGVDGQIGLESTPEEWAASLVAVFDQVKRVLRSDGTLWVECGDSYTSGDRAGHGTRIGAKQGTNRASALGLDENRPPTPPNAKPKDLIGQPFLLAFALRDAGWYWRNVCIEKRRYFCPCGCGYELMEDVVLTQPFIWHKPNPMPESVRDRFTVSHSYVLLFSKSPRYFFDAEAVREQNLTPPAMRDKHGEGYQADYVNGDRFSPGARVYGSEQLARRAGAAPP